LSRISAAKLNAVHAAKMISHIGRSNTSRRCCQRVRTGLESTIPNNGNTDHEDAAKLTVDLADQPYACSRVSRFCKTLIEMSAASRYTYDTARALRIEPLAALDSMVIMNLEEEADDSDRALMTGVLISLAT